MRPSAGCSSDMNSGLKPIAGTQTPTRPCHVLVVRYFWICYFVHSNNSVAWIELSKMARVGDVQLQRTFESTWSNPGSFPRCFREAASCLCFNNANNKVPMVLAAISFLSWPPNKQLVSGQAGSVLVLLTPSPVLFALGPSPGRTGIRPGLKRPLWRTPGRVGS